MRLAALGAGMLGATDAEAVAMCFDPEGTGRLTRSLRCIATTALPVRGVCHQKLSLIDAYRNAWLIGSAVLRSVAQDLADVSGAHAV